MAGEMESPMSVALDETHDADRQSWVEAANQADSDFSIQNLPFCVFRLRGMPTSGRIGVGIGDQILDAGEAARAGLLAEAGGAADALLAPTLNLLMGLGPTVWRRLRRAISALLSTDAEPHRRHSAAGMLVPMADVEWLMPADIGDFTDFYASIIHATNIGRLLRPDNPLLLNYKWVPIGYHGRGSSVSISGTPVVRPQGQTKAADASEPSYSPSRRLDFETELGFFVGQGNALGRPVPIGAASDHVFGVCLLNDWSARDIQAWEYQPLGPFLAKSFASTVSPFVVTMDALAPFRIPAYARPADDPKPLPYLADAQDQASGGLDIRIGVFLETEKMRRVGQAPHPLAEVRYSDMYWTIAQLVVHHTSNGCNLRPGDLIGSGTVSSREPGALGSLMELTQGGREEIQLPGGETRIFLEDGDAVIFRAYCKRDGTVRIGFGECRAMVEAAVAS